MDLKWWVGTCTEVVKPFNTSFVQVPNLQCFILELQVPMETQYLLMRM